MSHCQGFGLVGVALRVRVGTSVAVGGTDVAVGGTDVAVGGIRVAVETSVGLSGIVGVARGVGLPAGVPVSSPVGVPVEDD